MSIQKEGTFQIDVQSTNNFSDSYSIIIKSNLLKQLKCYLLPAEHYLVISDSNVTPLYGRIVKKNIENAGKPCDLVSFPAGEQNKNIGTFKLLHEQIDLKLDRTAIILNVGGGVTTDIGGFVAATYMRGIRFIHIPTSLLSMVDAAVGGKLGVNTSKGKNCIGLFRNPNSVLIDPYVLSTLEEAYWRDGFGEIIKHTLISPDPLLNLLHKYITTPKELKSKLLPEIIAASIKIKLNIVQSDFLEKGQRKLLNLGHTIGHALEENSKFSEITHGQAVTLGILVNAIISYERGKLDKNTLGEIRNLVQAFGLADSLHSLNQKIYPEKLISFLQFDKKTEKGRIMLILIQDWGKLYMCTDISNSEIKRGLEYIA